jgi:hypothetical protein
VASPSRTRFKVSQFDPKPLSWWKSRRLQIDMEPPYQRHGRLWSDTDKAYLIDSILNDFDVPKLYIADFTWGDSPLNKKKLPYAIIDGKQRFEAIFDFFDGKIALNEDFVFLKNPSLRLGGLGYRDLQKSYTEIAEEFETYPLTVMSVVADNEKLINELFVRLNRSKPLSGAEIRNAMAGPAPQLIRRISKHEFFDTNVSFPTKRGQDLNAAAKVLMFEYFGSIRETKKRNLDEFVKQAAKEKGKLELAARRVVDVLDDMTTLFLPNDKILGSAGILPVYYWFVRSVDDTDFSIVREFLVNFENERKENRRLVSEAPTSRRVDQELLEFDNFNRSTNDQQSHDGRFKILKRRFDISRQNYRLPLS